ncbi:MAG: hypothetical protein LUF02_03305 [Erysipelotrichaceae bacterium]|nr:hypothetical protein [Erysipelotrichaceae bacterium]
MIGYVKGYTNCTITKKRINDKTLSELIKVDNKIQNKLDYALNNDAYIVGLKKKKVLKCVYIFNKENDTLIFSVIIKTEEITDKILKAFEKDIIVDLKNKVSAKEIAHVEWNDVVIEPNNSLNWLAFGISLGVLFGIALDSIALGICFGVAFGCCCGVIATHK